MKFTLPHQSSALQQNETNFERLAEIKETRARLNNEIPYNEKISEKERLTSQIKDVPKTQMMGSAGSLELLMGGGFTKIGGLLKNVFKHGAKKIVAKEVSNKLDK
tara:strand:- start:174 stop:488 length:315 start_codon:yes stop_codon:yes gene_type:complete